MTDESDAKTAETVSEPATVTLYADDVELQQPHRVLLPRTTLACTSGELVVAVGRPGSGHTALALALAGRLNLSSGQVTLGESQDRARLQRSVALIDVPGVTEPDEGVPLHTIIGEELAMAGLPAGRSKVQPVAAEFGLGEATELSWGEVAALPRLRLMCHLASRRRGVTHLVLTYPERHGLKADELIDAVRPFTKAGFGVVITASRAVPMPGHVTVTPIGAEEELR
ncbi:hypothetical protein ACLM5J_06220 [Nocardioides sp. Bht2]|uniref:hypothetical protein n=1 Tax=Nocardioides sp. Bht2 TaxID=3392297 RepID=UPI0039B5BF51